MTRIRSIKHFPRHPILSIALDRVEIPIRIPHHRARRPARRLRRRAPRRPRARPLHLHVRRLDRRRSHRRRVHISHVRPIPRLREHHARIIVDERRDFARVSQAQVPRRVQRAPPHRFPSPRARAFDAERVSNVARSRFIVLRAVRPRQRSVASLAAHPDVCPIARVRARFPRVQPPARARVGVDRARDALARVLRARGVVARHGDDASACAASSARAPSLRRDIRARRPRAASIRRAATGDVERWGCTTTCPR